MLKKIFVSLITVLAVLAVVISLQPSHSHVERTLAIKAAPSDIYERINDLRKWHDWSPWAKIDPNAKITFSEVTEGVNASMAWDGNNDIGKGMMTIVSNAANERVTLRLDFEAPFKGTSSSALVLKQEGDSVLVTWMMDCENDFIGKAVSLVIDCDTMIGEKYAEGLANLKRLTEAH
jgi:hypothetical protein